MFVAIIIPISFEMPLVGKKKMLKCKLAKACKFTESWLLKT
jgi:hypothetical protein